MRKNGVKGRWTLRRGDWGSLGGAGRRIKEGSNGCEIGGPALTSPSNLWDCDTQWRQQSASAIAAGASSLASPARSVSAPPRDDETIRAAAAAAAAAAGDDASSCEQTAAAGGGGRARGAAHLVEDMRSRTSYAGVLGLGVMPDSARTRRTRMLCSRFHASSVFLDTAGSTTCM